MTLNAAVVDLTVRRMHTLQCSDRQGDLAHCCYSPRGTAVGAQSLIYSIVTLD